MAGRGAGKTRSGAEWVRAQVEREIMRIAIVGRTASDVRDVMVEGESGLLSVFPATQRPRYNPSKRKITFHTGAIARCYSADEPDLLRGPQQEKAWADEIAAWRYPEAWDNLMFGLRIGDDPQVLGTTTPRPLKWIRELLKDRRTVRTHETTYDNRANLAPGFLDEILTRYKGSRLGRQELNAELLEDNPDALWKRDQIDELRVSVKPEDLYLVVVSLDPSVTNTDRSDECGIIVGGRARENKHSYVLDDCSLRGSTLNWGQQAIAAYHRHNADVIVYEANQGGDLVRDNLAAVDPSVPVQPVWASRGKRTRAEPIATLYEKGEVHHVGHFPELEDEQCQWTPGDPSPNRMDALVYCLTKLYGSLERKVRVYN